MPSALTLRSGVLLILLAASGCTAVVFEDGAQCEIASDCARIGDATVEYVCSSEQVCVPVDQVQCAASTECVAELGVDTARCVEGRCVNLASEDCQSITPPELASNDDAIVIGFMGPLQGDFASIGVPIRQAAQMAFEEIDDTAAGIPLGGRRRPLVLVACNSLGDEEGLRAARHLVEEVRVPAIVGPLFSSITLNVISGVTVDAGVLNITPSATSPIFTDFPDDGLMWRTVPSDALQAIPLADQVTRAEAALRADLTVAEGEAVKVAIVANDGAYGQGLFDAVIGQVGFNNKTATENADDGNLLLGSYEDPAQNEQADLSPIQADLLDFQPHVVIALGTNEIVQQILIPVEAQWGSLPGSPPRPRWLLPDGGRIPELLTAALQDATSPPLEQRVRGTAGAQEGPNYEPFRLRFEQRFDEVPGVYTSNAYDAAYLVAYGIVASAEANVTGASVASGLQMLSAGMAVDVGPGAISGALNALGGGGTIDFSGASGPLDFDPSTGEAPANVDVWCVAPDNMGNPRFVSSGLVYDAASEAVVGVDACD